MVATALALAPNGGLGGTLRDLWAGAGGLLGYPALALLGALALRSLLAPLGATAAAVGALGAFQWELLAGLGLGRSGRWGVGPAALPAEALAPSGPLALALALLALTYGLFRKTTAAAADPRLGLLALLTLGVAVAEDFLTLYLTLEAANLTLYWLLADASAHRARRGPAAASGTLRRLEPLLAYFLLNLLGSLLLLAGLGLLYAATGAFSLGELALALAPSAAGLELLTGGLLPLASVCLLGGLTLKLGLAPFQGWVAPVYEALPAVFFVFLSLFPKGSLSLLLLRLGETLRWAESAPLVGLLLLLGSLNLAVGSLGALHQSSLRRLLIYSGLANLALVFYALALGSFGVGLVYLALYGATAAALLLPLLGAGSGLGERWTLPELSRGLATPLRATLSVATLNLSGVPPFALFFGKLPLALLLAERGWLLPLALLLGAGVVAVAYAFGLLAALWFWNLPATAPVAAAAEESSSLPWLLPPTFLALVTPALLAEGGAVAVAAPPSPLLPTAATMPLLGLLLGLGAEAALGGAATAGNGGGRRRVAAAAALPAFGSAPADDGALADYLPLLVLAAAAGLLVALLAAAARLVGSSPRLASGGRLPSSSYECGFVPYAGLVSGSLFVFYRLAVFFVVFEAELIFLLPWAVSLLPATEAGALRPYLAPLGFLVALAYGFGREVRGGALAL